MSAGDAMSRPFILASMANNVKLLVRMGKEGGAVDVYRLTYGRWEVDQLSAQYPTQLEVDTKTRAVGLVRKHVTETGVLMDRRDAKRLLAKCPPPWVEQEEAWDESDALDEVVKREHQQNGTGLTAFERKMRVTKASREDE